MEISSYSHSECNTALLDLFYTFNEYVKRKKADDVCTEEIESLRELKNKNKLEKTNGMVFCCQQDLRDAVVNIHDSLKHVWKILFFSILFELAYFIFHPPITNENTEGAFYLKLNDESIIALVTGDTTNCTIAMATIVKAICNTSNIVSAKSFISATISILLFITSGFDLTISIIQALVGTHTLKYSDLVASPIMLRSLSNLAELLFDITKCNLRNNDLDNMVDYTHTVIEMLQDGHLTQSVLVSRSIEDLLRNISSRKIRKQISQIERIPCGINILKKASRAHHLYTFPITVPPVISFLMLLIAIVRTYFSIWEGGITYHNMVAANIFAFTVTFLSYHMCSAAGAFTDANLYFVYSDRSIDEIITYFKLLPPLIKEKEYLCELVFLDFFYQHAFKKHDLCGLISQQEIDILYKSESIVYQTILKMISKE